MTVRRALKALGYGLTAVGIVIFVLGVFQVLRFDRPVDGYAIQAGETPQPEDNSPEWWIFEIPSGDYDYSQPDTDPGGGWDSDPDDWDSWTDSGSWDSGGWDSGSWDSGGWDSGSDSGSWDSGGWDSGSWDSGGWDSGGSDSGSW